MVVRAAIAAARERGDDLVMIMADADDWPQRLYERLGFQTVDSVPERFTPQARPASRRLRRRPPGVVRGLAQVAREGGVGDDADVPGVRLLGGERRRRGPSVQPVPAS